MRKTKSSQTTAVEAAIQDPHSKSIGTPTGARVRHEGRVEVVVTRPRAWHKLGDIVIWDDPNFIVGADAHA